MTALAPDVIADLLQPYIGSADLPPAIIAQLSVYLELILKWNVRVNLTAIRHPEEIVRRHFGESLFAGRYLDPSCDSLLDLGSGAGFPGVPIQLLKPNLSVTLAESRSRKAAFLREVIRELGIKTTVWADRVENMPKNQQFHTVTLRAVDDMSAAVLEASRRAAKQLLILGTKNAVYPELKELHFDQLIQIPNSSDGVIWVAGRID